MYTLATAAQMKELDRVAIEERGIPSLELMEAAAAAVAEKALPFCNIVCITGNEMQEMLSGYLAALAEQAPQAVGGKLPADNFYFVG